MNIISKLAACLVVASTVFLHGCALQVTRGSASVEVNTGVVNAKAEIEFEKKEGVDTTNSESSINILGKSTLSSSESIDLYLELYADNASIPDQQGSVKVSIVQDGALVSAATFSASIQNGILLADNPDEVDAWLSSHDQLTHGTIAFDVNDVNYVAAPGTTFEITNNLMVNDELLASANVFGIEPSYCGPDLCIPN